MISGRNQTAFCSLSVKGLFVHSCPRDSSAACDCSLFLPSTSGGTKPLHQHRRVYPYRRCGCYRGSHALKEAHGTDKYGNGPQRRLCVDMWGLGALLSVRLKNKTLRWNNRYYFKPMHDILHYGYQTENSHPVLHIKLYRQLHCILFSKGIHP